MTKATEWDDAYELSDNETRVYFWIESGRKPGLRLDSDILYGYALIGSGVSGCAIVLKRHRDKWATDDRICNLS